MRNDKHHLDDALWNAVLAFGKRLPTPGNHSRTPGDFTTEADGARQVWASFDVTQEDGSGRVYDVAMAVTVTVIERADDRDAYWGNHAAAFPEEQRVIVNGVHYLLGDGKSAMKGHGGRPFDIEFFDGRRITSTDLWHQGTIPPKWRERYPDNARFLRTNADFGLLRAGLPTGDGARTEADRLKDRRANFPEGTTEP